ncbi:MAG: glycosyltransferase [Caldilineaceae bacterium]|nr:glycosyltransferase [Caldilineaceae bacterium]
MNLQSQPGALSAPLQVEQSKPFATTLTYYAEDDRFAAKAKFIAVPPVLERGGLHLLAELQLLFRILVMALHHHCLLLCSHRGATTPELIAAALLGLWPGRWRPQIVFYGEMYEPDQSWHTQCAQWLFRLADRAIVRYVVYSQAETASFAQAWGVAPAKMRHALHPFYGRRKLHEIPFLPPATAGHIFAGGNSFRDYGPLVEAARAMPEQQFVICTTELDTQSGLPPNVRAGAVARDEFVRLMEEAAVVVVPLQRNTQRIAGALTYLEAMWLNKPTVVSDGLGVREYVVHGETGWLVDSTPQSYVTALRWILTPANEEAVATICAKAHGAVDGQFNMERHVTALLSVMAEVCGR